LSFIDLLNILKQVDNSINEFPTSANSIVIKIKNVFDKNNGLLVLKEILKKLQGDSAYFNN
jgi:hypothetical protein